MEAVELARQLAAVLHAQAVSLGLDPWQPYEFAVAEAKRRGIDVERTLHGAAVLENGRAAFIPEDQLILHENTGSPFDQAFLVAHELGHAELGDDPDFERPVAIDPLRPAEPSPIGVDRVIDYDRRQRREVQMDLFAREFLLPRLFVRKLHLQDNLTASAIAKRLGAPFEVVAQQLLDALLLPSITLKEETHPQRPLNNEQRIATEHRGKAYLLEAGPGTGKTQTLSSRVEALLAESVDPRRILLLTFSNKAAREMAERIARKDKCAAAAMWIGTFHAFGLDLIRRFHRELGLPKNLRMMDRTEAVELLEHEFPRLGLVHYRDLYDPTQNIANILAAISRAKDEVVDERQYAELAKAMRNNAASSDAVTEAEKAIEVAQVYEVYETLKRQANCIDFGDLVSIPVRLLEGNAAVRAHLQAQYDHVLVDEYQDVNRSSVRLLRALRNSGKNLWAVGDAKQSIYRFRGASSFNMTRFGKEDFGDGVPGSLKKNYRSMCEVVDTFSNFAVGMKVGGVQRALESDRGACAHHPELRTVNQAAQQSVMLADTIEEMRRAGHNYRDQAVLCTGNERLSALGQDLERLGVPVLFLGSLFERPEIKDLFCLLTILTDRRATGLVRIACWPDFPMPIADVAAVLDALSDDASAAGHCLREIDSLPGVSAPGRSSLTKLAAALNGFDESSPPWIVLATVLLDRTRIAARIADSDAVTDRARGIAIWQLMNFIRVQPSGNGPPIVRLLDRVRRLLRLGDDRDLRQLPAAAQSIDAVRLMTIHGAKGLEYPVVHIPNVNSDTIPRKSPMPPCPPPDGMVEGAQGSALNMFETGHAEEQECLFYVALSRARDRLFLYAPTQKSNGNSRPLSPFLNRLGQNLSRRHVNPSRELPLAPETAGIQMAAEGGLRFTARQIALYESCPRRFFYTHLLHIGGRRTATAFMQMHEAVRSVFQSAIAGAASIKTETELDQTIAEAFRVHGLADHGYAAHYKEFATAMIRYFISTREGHTPVSSTALRLAFGKEEIIVLPNEILVRPDGVQTIRSIRTGHQRSTDTDDVEAAAFMLAAQQAFPDAIVELVHLSDQASQVLNLTAKQLHNRQSKLAEFLQEIRQGRFPANRSVRVCPSCPAFFVCGPTPSGVLQKKF